MEQFVFIPYSVYQPWSTLPRKQKLEQKQEKEEVVPKNFKSVHSAVNAMLETSNNKHIIDLILNSLRNDLSQSDKIIIDNRDSKKIYCRLCVCTKAKKDGFSRYLLYYSGSNSFSS